MFTQWHGQHKQEHVFRILCMENNKTHLMRIKLRDIGKLFLGLGGYMGYFCIGRMVYLYLLLTSGKLSLTKAATS